MPDSLPAMNPYAKVDRYRARCRSKGLCPRCGHRRGLSARSGLCARCLDRQASAMRRRRGGGRRWRTGRPGRPPLREA